ncbi:hypothetical protein JTE90_012174 [Oedothorax gibbosus]|uniref:Uncharacterized protein n=1 Tax=Oedothorax gibbosus TaxID=931172 RepID=A0AAV6TE67_9ARAC|nr:hypothetical protein JTE90_012174 [Oedothorax gibbosus]
MVRIILTPLRPRSAIDLHVRTATGGTSTRVSSGPRPGGGGGPGHDLTHLSGPNVCAQLRTTFHKWNAAGPGAPPPARETGDPEMRPTSAGPVLSFRAGPPRLIIKTLDSRTNVSTPWSVFQDGSGWHFQQPGLQGESQNPDRTYGSYGPRHPDFGANSPGPKGTFLQSPSSGTRSTCCPKRHILPHALRERGISAAGLLPVHSPVTKGTLLVFFSLLLFSMLKFSGLSRLI